MRTTRRHKAREGDDPSGAITTETHLRSMSAAYIDAARNKINLARRHLAELDKFRRGEPEEREDIQMHFEGIVRSGESAGDQLAEAVVATLPLQLRNPSAQKVIKVLTATGDQSATFLVPLRRWVATPIVIDAHKRRREAVHHHYEKRPHKPLGTWMLDPLTINGAPSPYEGPLDVHTYCPAYVSTMTLLEETARELEVA